jgi:hypothetical protein
MENNIILYLDTPYENIYDDSGLILEPNLPLINTQDFVLGKDLFVDFTSPFVIPETAPGTPDVLSKD